MYRYVPTGRQLKGTVADASLAGAGGNPFLIDIVVLQ